jgi:hypothetical protein
MDTVHSLNTDSAVFVRLDLPLARLLADTVAETICDMSHTLRRYDPSGIRDDYNRVRNDVERLLKILDELPIDIAWAPALRSAADDRKLRPIGA